MLQTKSNHCEATINKIMLQTKSSHCEATAKQTRATNKKQSLRGYGEANSCTARIDFSKSIKTYLKISNTFLSAIIKSSISFLLL